MFCHRFTSLANCILHCFLSYTCLGSICNCLTVSLNKGPCQNSRAHYNQICKYFSSHDGCGRRCFRLCSTLECGMRPSPLYNFQSYEKPSKTENPKTRWILIIKTQIDLWVLYWALAASESPPLLNKKAVHVCEKERIYG